MCSSSSTSEYDTFGNSMHTDVQQQQYITAGFPRNLTPTSFHFIGDHFFYCSSPCKLTLPPFAPVLSDLTLMQILVKLLFQSQLWVADLPLQNRGPLLSSHTLDSSLPPVKAELTLLWHIFQVQCFESEPSMLSHCHTIQSDFQCNQRDFLKQIYDLALTSNATQAQLVLYCEALGMCDHEMKCCHKYSPFMEYLRNRIFFAFCDYLNTSFRSHSLSLKCFEASLYSILLHHFLVCLVPPKKKGPSVKCCLGFQNHVHHLCCCLYQPTSASLWNPV